MRSCKPAYNCAAKCQKYLGLASYAGPLPDGAPTISDEDEGEEWDSVSKDSMEEKFWNTACSID
jgi:hypothetical protein